MFKTTQEYDLAMKEILVRIRDGQPVNDLLENIDYCDALMECEKSGYITDISYWIDGNHAIHIQSPGKRVTRLGLSFIECTFS